MQFEEDIINMQRSTIRAKETQRKRRGSGGDEKLKKNRTHRDDSGGMGCGEG